MRRAFADLDGTARRLLALGEDWRSWSLVDRDPVDRWTDGRVTLLGDAAHPMLHYAAQGACQALEDAVVLGDLLADGRDGGLDDGTDAIRDRIPDQIPDRIPDLFEKYHAERHDRTARITHAARASTRLWHPAGAEAKARNEMLSALSGTALHDHVAWMHGAREFGTTGARR